MSITPNNLNSSKASVVPHSEIGTAVRRSREISEIELGADADPAKLRRLAAALQVAPSTFLVM
jgi:hypothetical protein